MKALIDLLDAISWPLAILLLGIVSAFGGLNRPLKAVSEAFGGIFKDLRSFKSELSEVDVSLKSSTKSMADHVDKIQKQVAEIDSAMRGKLSEIEKQIQAIRDLANQESKVALAEETGIEIADVNLTTLTQAEAHIALGVISKEWADLQNMLSESFPITRDIDRREYGQAIKTLAEEKTYDRLTMQLADQIASLHSRFKGFTRRRAFAEDWLTSNLRDSYVSDVRAVVQEIAAERA
jgi:hypothetical protein